MTNLSLRQDYALIIRTANNYFIINLMPNNQHYFRTPTGSCVKMHRALAKRGLTVPPCCATPFKSSQNYVSIEDILSKNRLNHFFFFFSL